MERKQRVAGVAEECEVWKMVKVTIIEESDDKIKILLADTDRALLNSIRRSLVSDTPKMAIETVRFEMGTIEQEDQVWETTGPLPDEVIAQRLAMIPIPTRHEEFHFQHMCPNCAELVEEDRGCPMCTMIYTCKAFGSKEGAMVTAKDLNYLGDSSLEIPELYKSIAITKLFDGQMIEFYATAIMGRGRDHAKWSPACGVTFEPRKIGKINNKTKINDVKPSKDTLRIFHQTIKKVTEDLNKLSFNTAVSQMMIFTNHMLDLEKVNKKVEINSEEALKKKEAVLKKKEEVALKKKIRKEKALERK